MRKNVLIVGLGLIGGSYALGLKKLGCHLSAISRSGRTIAFALEHGIIEKGTTLEDADLIGQADLVIFGLYPNTMVEWIRRNQQYFRPGALLTDVAGVKTGVVDVIQGFLREDVEFLGCHPMAGRELSGIQNADAKIFQGANFIVTPTEKNTPEAIAELEELAKALGFGHITTLSPQEHDKMIGFVSQLTHVLAVALMNTSDNTHLKEYTGDSFRDLTRIAKINGEMWSELFLLNKTNLVGEIDALIASLESMKTAILQDDTQALKEQMALSTQRRSYFDK